MGNSSGGSERLDPVAELCIKELAGVERGSVSWLSGRVDYSTKVTLDALRRCKRHGLVECSPDESFWHLTDFGELLFCYLETGSDRGAR